MEESVLKCRLTGLETQQKTSEEEMTSSRHRKYKRNEPSNHTEWSNARKRHCTNNGRRTEYVMKRNERSSVQNPKGEKTHTHTPEEGQRKKNRRNKDVNREMLPTKEEGTCSGRSRAKGDFLKFRYYCVVYLRATDRFT